VCLLGFFASGWLDTGIVAGVLFVLACAVMAWYVKPADLLSVVVCPPLVFFVACACAKAATSSGATSAAEGILLGLADTAPWLFGGTALTLVIALRRGLLADIRELRADLRGDSGVPRRGRAAGYRSTR
jgi:hypothetical protein